MMTLENLTSKQKKNFLSYINKLLIALLNDHSLLERQQAFSNSIDRDIERMQRQQNEKEAEEMILKNQAYLQTRKITNVLNPIVIQDEEEDKSIVEKIPKTKWDKQ